MKVEILSPGKSLFDGEAKFVFLPGSDGSMGILDNHAALITTLQKGVVKIELSEGKTESFEVSGGTVEVLNNRVIILAE